MMPELLAIILLATRIAVGLFFAISGYHKLTNKSRHESLVATLTMNNIPLVKYNQWFVPIVEFGAGISLTAGFLFPLPLIGLLAICLVACITDGAKRIAAWQPIDKADVLDDILYLPEVLYIILISILLATGETTLSLDQHFGSDIAKMLLVDLWEK